MTQLSDDQNRRLRDLAHNVRDHFDSIEQDVPDQSYLVGGAVRDTLMGSEPNDFDFVVVGETEASMKERGFQPIEASSFPVFHDSDHEEWALAREEEKDGVGYDGFEVFTDDVSLRQDLERRDIRSNAMALSTHGLPKSRFSDGELLDKYEDGFVLIDPFGGCHDIDNGVLRHVSDAFSDDPLRTLRVARYAARFGFSVHESTKDMMRQVAPELNLMSRDRIGDEIVKALDQAEFPSIFFEMLEESGVLAVMWPELHRATQVLAGSPEHHAEGTVFAHTMMVVDRMNELCDEHNITGENRVRRLLMAVAHDIGKVVVADKKGGIHSDDPPMGFPDHANIGASVMEDSCRRMGLDAQYKAVMQDACELHMRFHDIPMMSLNELNEFISDHFPSGLNNDGMRELPTNDDGEPHSFYGATAWELLDLAHADHEGRLKQIFRDDGGGVTDTKRTVVDRPEFDRDEFVEHIEAVFNANQSVDGYEALESGLCDEHTQCEIDRRQGYIESEDSSVQALMNQCPMCRTPDGWVGQKLEAMKLDEIEKQLVGDEQ